MLGLPGTAHQSSWKMSMPFAFPSTSSLSAALKDELLDHHFTRDTAICAHASLKFQKQICHIRKTHMQEHCRCTVIRRLLSCSNSWKSQNQAVLLLSRGELLSCKEDILCSHEILKAKNCRKYVNTWNSLHYLSRPVACSRSVARESFSPSIDTDRSEAFP